MTCREGSNLARVLQFRLSWLFEKKRIRARSQNFLRSTMASSSKKTCVRGRWAELVDFYYFHVQSAAAHMMHIKVYARTSTQTNASLLSNCRPPTARVHGGQARTRRTLNWRKHEARVSARAYIRSRGRPWCGGLGIGKLPAGLTFVMADLKASCGCSDGRARRHPRRSESKLL